jgi:hypothetical protein
MSFTKFLFLSTFLIASSGFEVLAADSKGLSTFKVAGIKGMTLSVPKGRISVTSSLTQKDITVNVIEPSKKYNDNKKCHKVIGLDGSNFVVKVSSENILFEKADCDYDIVIVAPAAVNFDLDINSGSAMVIVKDMTGNLNIKAGTGSVIVDGDVLKNIDVKSATGPIEFSYKKCLNRADLNFLSVTSKITLELPEDCKVRVDHKSATGKLFNALGDSEDYLVLVTAKSASGDFTIKKTAK